MKISPRSREYLTTASTLDELHRQEPEMRAAGFRKRRNAHGQAKTIVVEFFQWWDRKGIADVNIRRQSGRCVRCGEKVAQSKRSGKSQWCKVHLEEYRQYAKNYYHQKLKPARKQLSTSPNP